MFAFFLLLILTSLFNQNYAGLFNKIERLSSESLSQYYLRIRSSSVNRGVVLSISSDEQKELCHDLLSSQTLKNKGILFPDGPTEAYIVVRKMIFESQVIAENDIFVECPPMNDGIKITNQMSKTYTYYISYAFETNAFHLSRKHEWIGASEVKLVGEYNVSKSPEFDLLGHIDVRDLYSITRRNIEALRRESPGYLKMVERNDSTLTLSDEERLLICSSILAAPHFQSENLEIDSSWMEETEVPEVYYRPIQFLNEDNTVNELKSYNALCKVRDRGTHENFIFYYTPSYSNENSVYFMTIYDSYLQFYSYIKNIPILMHAERKSRVINSVKTS